VTLHSFSDQILHSEAFTFAQVTHKAKFQEQQRVKKFPKFLAVENFEHWTQARMLFMPPCKQ